MEVSMTSVLEGNMENISPDTEENQLSDLIAKVYHIAAPNMDRVIAQFFIGGDRERSETLVRQILSLSAEDAHRILDKTLQSFKHRHQDLPAILIKHFQAVHRTLPDYNLDTVDKEKKLLIGAYFTMEYAFEAAAFLNPSIVFSPDQSNLSEGEARIILSFRTIGEGHVSSLVFRGGIITQDHQMILDPTSQYAQTPSVIKNPIYLKDKFRNDLRDVNIDNLITDMIFRDLPPDFTFNQLEEVLENIKSQKLFDSGFQDQLFHTIRWIAQSNYSAEFCEDSDLSERVIFPMTENERHGIEDARFVRFIDDDGTCTYYSTYTAYSGTNILPQIFKTKDFIRFETSTLNGMTAKNKGMALFPRKISGLYAMLSRLDGVQLFLMYSDNLYYWHSALPLRGPTEPWEFVQMGNCGSPIETEEGWLLLTHGVGPMRQYCLGIELLDLEDPLKIIGRLRQPLLIPSERERSGYVPNVIYSCGGLVHNGCLILPYAYSDYASKCAVIPLEPLIKKLKEDKG